MKKVQRSFAVEYKSGRRKPDPKFNSIWGNMDLRSVARDVEEEAMPFLSGSLQNVKSDPEVSLAKAKQAEPLLTLPLGQHTTASDKQETIMAAENELMTNADTPAVVETPNVPKKQRRPRAKKATASAVFGEVASEPAAVSTTAAGKHKRGRKAKSIEGASVAKRAYVKRTPKAAQIATAVPTAAIEEMADLLQLEEENQRLRKLLAEKLRAENADLRKRLRLD